jgi:crossover junction endodeoxyribonuclease RuvC
MILMGIDPGTVKAGYGVIQAEGSEIKPVAYGVAKGGSKKKSCYGDRLRNIYNGLTSIISQYKPEIIILETAFYNKSIETSIKIGEGRGIAILAAANSGVELVEIPPAIVKKAVTGRGDARKSQVGEMVKLILGLDEVPSPDDASDALACAIAGYHRLTAGEKIAGADE